MKVKKSELEALKASIKQTALAKAKAGVQKSSGDPGKGSTIEVTKEHASISKLLRGHMLNDWADADVEKKLYKAYNTEIGIRGAFLVHPIISTEIIEALRAKSVVRQMPGVRQINLGGKRSLKMGRIDASVSVSWGDENTTIASDNTLTFGEVKIELNKAVALVPLSHEIIQAANPSIDAIIKADLTEGIALKQDLAFLEGTGGTQPLGFYYNPQILNTDLSGSASFDTFADAEYQVEAQNGKLDGWIMHPRMKNSLRQLKDGFGRYLWADATTIAGGGREMPAVLGYPVSYSTQIPVTLRPGSNETYALGGQWSNLLIGDGDTLRLDTSTEAGDAFALDQMWIRAIAETDAALRHPLTFVRIIGIQA